MKNIHLLPTQNPSRLIYNSTTKKLDLYKMTAYSSQSKNIYITNSEEIKVGDWVYSLREGLEPILKQKVNTIGVNNDEMMKKIILTTDQDLIKDGVQAIPDEFLEWFVKNPSCEVVEIVKYEDNNSPMLVKDKTFHYKIIIPKEEPKKEILEEVAEKEAECRYPVLTHSNPKNSPYVGTKQTFKHGVRFGGKWQQEQDKKMYSEGEVFDLLQNFNQNAMEYIKQDDRNIMTSVTLQKWFEQFKKK